MRRSNKKIDHLLKKRFSTTESNTYITTITGTAVNQSHNVNNNENKTKVKRILFSLHLNDLNFKENRGISPVIKLDIISTINNKKTGDNNKLFNKT